MIEVAGVEHSKELVILLHGMSRTERSMANMAGALETAGFATKNIRYPSRKYPLEELSRKVVGGQLAQFTGHTPIHFVTHSLGGILVRHHLSSLAIPHKGRVVMLGPPNQGSEVVDRLKDWKVFQWLNGPVGGQLGTDPADFGAVNFELGIIAGNRSINWINSTMITGADDGKVSVERTKVAGMTDHLVLPVTHPLMMRNPEVIAQTIHFLKFGKFNRAAAR